MSYHVQRLFSEHQGATAAAVHLQGGTSSQLAASASCISASCASFSLKARLPPCQMRQQALRLHGVCVCTPQLRREHNRIGLRSSRCSPVYQEFMSLARRDCSCRYICCLLELQADPESNTKAVRIWMQACVHVRARMGGCPRYLVNPKILSQDPGGTPRCL